MYRCQPWSLAWSFAPTHTALTHTPPSSTYYNHQPSPLRASPFSGWSTSGVVLRVCASILLLARTPHHSNSILPTTNCLCLLFSKHTTHPTGRNYQPSPLRASPFSGWSTSGVVLRVCASILLLARTPHHSNSILPTTNCLCLLFSKHTTHPTGRNYTNPSQTNSSCSQVSQGWPLGCTSCCCGVATAVRACASSA